MALLFVSKVIFSAIEFYATVVLSLSIFRIPFRYRLGKIALISLVMGFLTTYFREIVDMNFALLPVIIAEITLVMIFFSIPIFYSILVSVIGYLSGSLIETLLVLAGSGLSITSQELIKNAPLHLFSLEICTALIIWLFVGYLQKRKIGFLFLVKHLSFKGGLRGYNFVLSAILLLGVLGMQFELLAFSEYSVEVYFPIILSVILLVGLGVAYVHNKNIIKEKYEKVSLLEQKLERDR
jgi:hypothetical protein